MAVWAGVIFMEETAGDPPDVAGKGLIKANCKAWQGHGRGVEDAAHRQNHHPHAHADRAQGLPDEPEPERHVEGYMG